MRTSTSDSRCQALCSFSLSARSTCPSWNPNTLGAGPPTIQTMITLKVGFWSWTKLFESLLSLCTRQAYWKSGAFCASRTVSSLTLAPRVVKPSIKMSQRTSYSKLSWRKFFPKCCQAETNPLYFDQKEEKLVVLLHAIATENSL